VLIAEPHHLLRRGLRHLLDAEREVDVVSVVRTGHEALEAIRAILFDVVIVDLRLPDGDGVELARRMREVRGGLRIVMLAERADRHAILRAVSAGVHGFVSGDAEEKELVSTVVAVGRGRKLFDPTVAAALPPDRTPRPRLDRIRFLTAQERMVLELLAQGLPNRDIAERAHLAEKTVRNYVSRVLLKLGVRNRTEAALYAAQRDIALTGA
jgi:DNA-binding NarL/FixJ family response regulator